jgi:hypothetical protein
MIKIYRWFGLAFLLPLSVWAQVEDSAPNLSSITEVCYKTYEYETMEVSDAIHLESLSMVDKLRMKHRSMEHFVHEGLDNGDQFFRESTLIEHENHFPAWYRPSYKVRTDANGSTSYYMPDNPYLSGGWGGASSNGTAEGDYFHDIQTNEYLYRVPHSSVSLEIQELKTERVINYGAIYDYVFHYPSTAELQVYANNGYTINMEGQIRSIHKDSVAIFWDEGNKIKWHIITEGSDTLSSVSVFYKYSEQLGFDIIAHTVTKIKTYFQNGDCGEQVIYRYYDEWNTACQTTDLRASLDNSERKDLGSFPKSYG